MNTRFRLLFIALLTNQFAASSLEAQVLSGFNYQGQLNNGGNPASGLFDLRFTIHDASTNGNALASPLTNAPVSVSNGLFNAALDFGPNVFTGDPRWLEIGVRTNGDLAAYTTLQPRQRLGPVPYAIFAGGVSATGITGTISTANLGPGTITSNQLAAGAVGPTHLAPGAVAANLEAGGLGGVPSTGVLLAESANATNLLNAGFLKIGEASIGEGWLWRAATNILGPRVWHSAVWTGTEMIIWGGEFYDGTYHYYNTGARYNPTTARWTTMSTSNAPIPRSTHVAVWTGTEMIVWGGIYVIAGDHYLNDGGRYNPATDTWTPITTTDAPGPRYNGRAVWSGSEMIVWGGTGPGIRSLADGGRYDPVSNFWSSVSPAGQPTARSVHSAIWTGTEMIVWGGIYYQGGNQRFNDGGRYHPGSNSWTAVSTAVAPDARTGHSAIWTGTAERPENLRNIWNIQIYYFNNGHLDALRYTIHIR